MLDIGSVEVNGNVVKVCFRLIASIVLSVSCHWQARLDSEHPVMGSALHVPLPVTRAKETVWVRITYKTTEACPALMWLEKEHVLHISHREIAHSCWVHLQADGRQRIPVSVQSMPTDPCAQFGTLAR